MLSELQGGTELHLVGDLTPPVLGAASVARTLVAEPYGAALFGESFWGGAEVGRDLLDLSRCGRDWAAAAISA